VHHAVLISEVPEMQEQEIEIFIHAQGVKPQAVSALLGHTLRDTLTRAGLVRHTQADTLVFVGECEVALSEADDVENGADIHAPADIDLTLEALTVCQHHAIHCHHCRHIAVEVNFGSKTKARKFSPATTVGVVTRWARRKFHLDPASASEYVLQVLGTTTQPRSDEHLGSILPGSTCSIGFDLVKEVTPQG
jgi:hypothetical protein